MTAPAYRIDAAEVRRALELLLRPGQVTELRALGAVVEGERRPGTFSGYFDSADALIDSLLRIKHASGIYFVPKEVNPALLARSHNRARMIYGREPLTTDGDISHRKWLLVDVDPVRPAGISSTAAEKAAAEGLITSIDYRLWELGWPPGIIGDSGNGAHLMIPVNLPADDGGWCQQILQRLAAEFDTATAKVDVSVHNAARIWKLYGTMSRKGDHAPEIGRPWRLARILTVCKHTTERV